MHKPFATADRPDFIRAVSTAELVKLPVAERLALIDDLLVSIAESERVPDGPQLDEARSRLRELKADPALGLSYEELKSRLG